MPTPPAATRIEESKTVFMHFALLRYNLASSIRMNRPIVRLEEYSAPAGVGKSAGVTSVNFASTTGTARCVVVSSARPTT